MDPLSDVLSLLKPQSYSAGGFPVDGDLAGILHATGSGLISGFEDADQLEKNILTYFYGIHTARNEAEINKYSRKELTHALCDLLAAL